MDRVEIRELTYFLAVAEEGHVGRAAQSLGITQPPLSRALHRLERRLGVTLFDRVGRGLELTEAGQVLRAESKELLAALDTAVWRTQRAGTRERHLTLVTKPGMDGGLLPGLLAAYADTPGARPVDVVTTFPGRTAMLRDGRADLALLYAHRDDLTGLDVHPLRTTGQVALLPHDHRLAGRDGIRRADLTGETLPRYPEDGAGPSDTSGAGPLVEHADDLLQLVALGRTVAILPASSLGTLRPDVVTVPVVDAEPVTLLLAWSTSTRDPAVAAFARTAADL